MPEAASSSLSLAWSFITPQLPSPCCSLVLEELFSARFMPVGLCSAYFVSFHCWVVSVIKPALHEVLLRLKAADVLSFSSSSLEYHSLASERTGEEEHFSHLSGQKAVKQLTAERCVCDKAVSVGVRPAGWSCRAAASAQWQIIYHPPSPAEGPPLEDRVRPTHGDRLSQDPSNADSTHHAVHAKGDRWSIKGRRPPLLVTSSVKEETLMGFLPSGGRRWHLFCMTASGTDRCYWRKKREDDWWLRSTQCRNNCVRCSWKRLIPKVIQTEARKETFKKALILMAESL